MSDITNVNSSQYQITTLCGKSGFKKLNIIDACFLAHFAYSYIIPDQMQVLTGIEKLRHIRRGCHMLTRVLREIDRPHTFTAAFFSWREKSASDWKRNAKSWIFERGLIR
jgi:hypothetical protein